MAFALRDLGLPVLGAPMAGGPGTPGLAAAVATAGGLGFLAGGYLTSQRLAEDIAAARSLTGGPLGVNLFVPQRELANPQDVGRYRVALRPLAEFYGVEVGEPRWDDDGWAEKLDLLLDIRPELVSFTFALPDVAVFTRLRHAGVTTAMTVTTSGEARAAAAAGADLLVVQGPGAGGHRGTWTAAAPPPNQPLTDLLAEVRRAVSAPLVAAGALATAVDVAGALAAGAAAVQIGTALLLAEEAGTNPVHRRALSSGEFSSGEFSETVVTRCFSGRPARGLANDFTRRLAAIAPVGYPELHHMTSPIRRAAVAAGDPHGTNLWAGTGFGSARAGSAADIIDRLGV